MAKLSRKDRYKDLRDQIDLQSEASQKASSSDASPRKAAPDKKAQLREEQSRTSGVILDHVLDEVTQYNMENGDIVSDDPQMQILHDLAAAKENGQRRNAHLEKMETNEQAGGTTRNIYGGDISALAAKSSPEPAPAAEEVSKPEEDDAAARLSAYRSGEEITGQELAQILAAVSTETTEQPAVQEEAIETETETEIEAEPAPNTKKKRSPFFSSRKKRYRKLVSEVRPPAELIDDEEEIEIPVMEPVRQEESLPAPVQEKNEPQKETGKTEPALSSANSEIRPEDAYSEAKAGSRGVQERKAGRASTIFLIVVSIIFFILVILLIYMMSSLGIF